ncbi:hypothetical protein KPL71_014557 [Citrus sinensis]|uniref:Uncharacterized protein n=1 Tax=Citrus sinensis TaxID=2711 RepID=A0ACB8KCH6_CITSI|nr:hypothetical protein KPL71_014557 [Citrus sinensis]
MLAFEYVKELYANDSDFVDVFATRDKGSFGKFYEHDGYLFRENKLCVPNSSMRDLLVREAHSGGLMGHFEIVYGYNPLTLMDLILVLVDARAKLDGQKKAELVKSIHEQAQLHIEKKNEQYVTQVNKGSKRLILNPLDLEAFSSDDKRERSTKRGSSRSNNHSRSKSIKDYPNMEATSSSISTPSSSSSPISLSSTLSLPKSCSKHITSKIENLVEYSYIPESAQINESQFPIMGPYNLYKQTTSFTRSLPVTARIALLDTRFKQYQHTIVGTILTTLHAGSVLLTFYPNFNLSFEDPNLPTTLKVQIQLQGAEQTPTSKIATLHHQIVYRLQNHALDLPTPHTTSDALMILADTNTIPTIIQIPKQIHKQELLKLMPLEWLTNYEHFHQNSEPVQTTEATFERQQNGQVKLSFQTPETKHVSATSQLSYTAMITAVQTGQEKKLLIHGFSSEEYPVYPDNINGHFLWDVPEALMCNPDCPCLDDTDVDDELDVMRRKKKKKKKSSHPKPSCKSFPPQRPPDPKPPVHLIRSCLMFSSQSYEESFPPLEKQTDTQTRVISKPFVQSQLRPLGSLKNQNSMKLF